MFGTIYPPPLPGNYDFAHARRSGVRPTVRPWLVQTMDYGVGGVLQPAGSLCHNSPCDGLRRGIPYRSRASCMHAIAAHPGPSRRRRAPRTDRRDGVAHGVRKAPRTQARRRVTLGAAPRRFGDRPFPMDARRNADRDFAIGCCGHGQQTDGGYDGRPLREAPQR